MSTVTNLTLPVPVQQKLAQKMLATPVPYLIYNTAAEKKYFPRNSGTILKFLRYNRLPPATVPLGPSGATPPATPLAVQEVQAQMGFYGAWMAINQQVNKVACSKPLVKTLEPLREAA